MGDLRESQTPSSNVIQAGYPVIVVRWGDCFDVCNKALLGHGR